MKLFGGMKFPFGKNSNSDEEQLPQETPAKDYRGRFLKLSREAKASSAGVAYGELISRNTKIIRSNLVAVVVIAGLTGKILFFTDPVTIVIPPNMSEEITITGNKVSESYKTQWALFFSTMIGNINPNNINFVTEYILKALSPDLQAKIGETLQSQINIMQTRGVDQTFSPNDIYYDPKNDVVYVWGTKTTKLINVPDKTESSKWTFEWVLGMKNGLPRIAYVNQYSGTPNIKKITINGKEQVATLNNPPPSTGN